MKKDALKKLVKQCIAEVITEGLALTPAGNEDEWGRPVYTDASGKVYVDINLGKGTPSIHSTSAEGEPEYPIKNYTLTQEPMSDKDRFKNALCPRCKNSKPEYMKKLPDGKMSCTSCNWADNPDEPYNPRTTKEQTAPQEQWTDTFGKKI